MSETTDTTSTETVTPINTGVSLTLPDLQAIRAIFEVAIQRGTFKPQELVSVGTVFNKLDNFINSIPTDTTSKGQ